MRCASNTSISLVSRRIRQPKKKIKQILMKGSQRRSRKARASLRLYIGLRLGWPLTRMGSQTSLIRKWSRRLWEIGRNSSPSLNSLLSISFQVTHSHFWRGWAKRLSSRATIYTTTRGPQTKSAWSRVIYPSRIKYSLKRMRTSTRCSNKRHSIDTPRCWPISHTRSQ
jgi:hypothetical protein